MNKGFTLNTNADDETPSFPAVPHSQLTIHCSAASGSPSGTISLQIKNVASGLWENVDTSSAVADFPAVSGSDVDGVANFRYPPLGELRIKYTRNSGGAANGLDLHIIQYSVI